MKRTMAVLVSFLLLLEGAWAAVSIRMEDTAALLNRDGTMIVAPGEYRDIVPLGDGFFAAGDEEGYALMNDRGICLTDALYSQLRIENGLILARENGKWGLLYRDGSPRSSFDYSLILPGSNGNCWALKDDPDDMNSDKLFRIDPNGKLWATRLYVRSLGRSPGEDLLSVRIRGESLSGYCDALGNMVIPAAYEYAGDFVNGLAAVVQGGRYGAIDAQGGTVVPAEYDFMEISDSGLIVAAREREGAYVFDREGRQIAAYAGEDVHIALVGAGYAVVDSQFLYVFDEDAALVLEAPSDAVALEGVNGQLIISDGMWGEECVYLNDSLRAEPLRYQNIYPLGTAGDDGIYAYMTANVGRYMNDLLGEVQLSTDMDSARYGVLGSDGEMLTDARWLSLSLLEDDRLLARTEDAWQMIDSRGKVYWEHAATRSAEPSF